MLKKLILLTGIAAMAYSCTQAPEGMEALNAQAAEEYLVPIRPASEGRNPCWNGFAQKFIYAPVFDFQKVEGAASYKYTINDVRKPENVWSFEAEGPDAPLSPVWNDIYPADVHLVVEALDASGKVIGKAGERDFLRDFPFEGPYPGKAMPYRESAMRAALYTHRMPAVQAWKTQTVPDLSYQLNAYPNKIHGATLSNEAYIADNIPEYKEDALLIARNAAQFLIDQSFPEGHPLEFFPPTFYQDKASSGWAENKGTTMVMDACMAADGFLDLYKTTKEEVYLDKLLKIIRTYSKLQAEDGSFPIKVYVETGEPINDAKAMLEPILSLLYRVEKELGIKEFVAMKDKAVDWMEKNPVETFDMTGEFEDTYRLGGIQPYENLTNCTAAMYASYLLKQENPSDKDIKDATDLIRMSEDQFVRWNYLPDDVTGVREVHSPITMEQYFCYEPVDDSSANMANAYLDLYAITGDKLLLEKARALMDHLTILQNQVTGMIISIDEPVEYFWINCSWITQKTLLRLADVVGE
ncbi:MAG: hypothetical protein MJY84_05700 [Bacteroidales bacterium]|nr:hypothetical protein [Bacteroidales bacterium]